MYTPPRYTLAHIPFLRILIPLIVGIVWQHVAPSTPALYICCSIALGAGMIAWRVRKQTFSATRQWSFGMAVFATFTTIGMAVCIINTPSTTLPQLSNSTIAIARIENTPTEQEYSYRTQATIVAFNDSNTSQKTEIKIQLYLQKSFTAQNLQCGDLIIFRPQLQPIENRPIPYAFDYAQFMAQKGILFRQYLSDGDWQLSQFKSPLNLRYRAKHIQQQCLEALHRCQLSPETTALLSALLWGYKENIPTEIRQYFSAAGLSHILAVSGLHTGIIGLIIWIILYPLRYTSIRYVRGIITITLLWAYAFITGLSPSVVRACIMATFVGTATILNRRNTSLNALCGSAMMVLLFSPQQLFDIGFQLSYTAVAGIILFSPHLNIGNYLNCNNTIVRYICTLISTTLAAQIATTPLAAYYFHYIPIWGMLSNLLLTPLLTPLMLLAFAMQLFEALQLPHLWLDIATDILSRLLTTGANTIASLPGATIDGIWITLPTLLLYSIMLIAIWYAISRRTLRPATIIITALIALQCIILYDTVRPSTPLAILPTERKFTHIQLADNNRNCLIISTDSCQTIPTTGSEWRIHEHLKSQLILAYDTIATPHIYAALPFVEFYGKRILWIDNNDWRHTHSSHPIHIDYAIVTEKYTGRISPLLKNCQIDTIVLSAAIYPQKATELYQECVQHNIPCHNSQDNNTWYIKP